jgi:hypothetical protein
MKDSLERVAKKMEAGGRCFEDPARITPHLDGIAQCGVIDLEE